jgi:hypothetical protein
MKFTLIYFFIPFFNKYKYYIYYTNKTIVDPNDDCSMIPKKNLPKNSLIFIPKPNYPI